MTAPLFATALIAAASARAQDRWTEEVTVPHAAFTHAGQPSAIVHAPPGFDRDAPIDVVVYLHGWNGCARVIAASGPVACAPGGAMARGWGLAAEHDRSGSHALLVVAQLALRARDGSPGAWDEPGVFRAFLDEMLVALAGRLGAGAGIGRVRAITLVAHSAGHLALVAVAMRGGVDDLVRDLVLLDSLYTSGHVLVDWASRDARRRIVSIHSAQPGTTRQNFALAVTAQRVLGPAAVVWLRRDPDGLGPAIRRARVVAARTSAGHRAVPARHLAEVLGALAAER